MVTYMSVKRKLFFYFFFRVVHFILLFFLVFSLIAVLSAVFCVSHDVISSSRIVSYLSSALKVFLIKRRTSSIPDTVMALNTVTNVLSKLCRPDKYGHFASLKV